jgi:hypothetical protein
VTEHQVTISLRNVGKYTPKDTASHLRGLEPSGEIILWGHVSCLTYFQFVVYREMAVTQCYMPWAFGATVTGAVGSRER